MAYPFSRGNSMNIHKAKTDRFDENVISDLCFYEEPKNCAESFD